MNSAQPPFVVMMVIIPLLTSFLIPILGHWRKDWCFPLVPGAVLISLLCALRTMVALYREGPVRYFFGGWYPPWGIIYEIDYLNGFISVLICFLFLLSAVSSKKSIEKELPFKEVPFYALFLLLFTGLLGIVLTGDIFNLYVFLEVASLTAYALIAMGKGDAMYSSFRYLIMGTVGASLYLLGVGYIYIATGSLNMGDLSRLLPDLFQSKAVLIGFAFVLLGLALKMALFPMHIWLPDAYAAAPSAVSAVIGPIMTKVMVYVLIRMLFTVFGFGYADKIINATGLMTWFGTAAIVFGSLSALTQNDFKKMLGYILVAEIGYIVGGIGVANTDAVTGALFHLLNDALMIASMFLTAMMVNYQAGDQNVDPFIGLFKKMPLTAVILTIGALAIIGVPPTCGFFSKWYLLMGGIRAGEWGFVAALLMSTLINVALFFRILDKAVFIHSRSPGSGSLEFGGGSEVKEAPWSMMIPGITLAAAILSAGIFNQTIIHNIIRFALPLEFQ
ncbi:MAG: proton-conducting transporter membrane subunit [Thermodesulfobacteriota bacterium]